MIARERRFSKMLTCVTGRFTLVGMDVKDPSENIQEKVRRLEAELAASHNKLQASGVELEANEGLMKFMMDDMRRIYEDLMRSQSQLMQSDKLAKQARFECVCVLEHAAGFTDAKCVHHVPGFCRALSQAAMGNCACAGA